MTAETETDTPQDADNAQVTPGRQEARKLWLTRLATAVAAIAFLWLLYWFFFARGYVHTDNAYVGADSAQVTPLVAGAVKAQPVGNTQMVKKGDILLVLDDADARIELANARAAYLQAIQKFNQARVTNQSLGAQVQAQQAGISQANAEMLAAQANYAKARDAAARREALAGTGAVSNEELSQARADLADARSAYERAQAQVLAARASRASAQGQLAVNQVLTQGQSIDTSPDVVAAKARLDAAQLAFSRTVIRSPITGVVTQNNVQIGQRVAPGSVAMIIVPIDAAFVDANFKESQLKNVRPGQRAELTSDYYGSSVVYRGVVKGLAGGTGSAFSLIPAQNATGNWVKVVQRLPVRIALDPKQLREHPLRVGLSMDVEVDTR